MQGDTIPIWIIHSIKMNKEYKDLLKNLKINKWENIQALYEIEDSINSNYNFNITKNLKIYHDVQYDDKSW